MTGGGVSATANDLSVCKREEDTIKGEERPLLIVVLAPGAAVSAQSIEAHLEGKWPNDGCR